MTNKDKKKGKEAERKLYISEWLWNLDNGETYTFFEKNQFRKFREAGKCALVSPSLFGKLQLKEKRNGIVTGFGKNGRTIWVVKKGTTTSSSYWVGFWKLKETIKNDK